MAPSAMCMPVNDQHNSPLFKLAPELRNTIYNLVFSTTSNDEGTIDFDDTTPPAKALISTCQLLYQESHGIYKTAFREYCNHEFVIRKDCLGSPYCETLGNEVLLHITRVRVVFDASLHNRGEPWQFIINLIKEDPSRAVWKASASVHGTHFQGPAEDERRRSMLEHRVSFQVQWMEELIRMLGCQPEFNTDFAVTQAIQSFQ